MDGGAVGKISKIAESEINLSVAMKLKKCYENAGIKVVMTRSTPQGLYGIFANGFKKRDLQKRVEITKKANADIFVSIHMNKFSSATRCGAQVFFKDDKKSEILAYAIQNELDKIDTDTRKGNVLMGDYYVLNCSPIPAVICECGFLSSEVDEARLITDEYQNQLAYSIFVGTCAYFYENVSADYMSNIEKNQ